MQGHVHAGDNGKAETDLDQIDGRLDVLHLVLPVQRQARCRDRVLDDRPDGGLRAHADERSVDKVFPAHRALVGECAERAFEAAGLPEDERDMIRRQDWRALIHRGASSFVLEKLAAVTGVSNLHVYAAMRGQSLEDFMKTRNAPGALYSVAARTVDWD